MGLVECLHRELSIGSGQDQGGKQKNTSKKTREVITSTPWAWSWFFCCGLVAIVFYQVLCSGKTLGIQCFIQMSSIVDILQRHKSGLTISYAWSACQWISIAIIMEFDHGNCLELELGWLLLTALYLFTQFTPSLRHVTCVYIIHVALSWPEANHMLHVQNQSWRHFCNVRKSLGQSLTKERRGKL